MYREKKESPVLFVFIEPRELNDLEQLQFEELNDENKEYKKGVINGWSILFLGHAKKIVFKPGICTRKEMLDIIPESYLIDDLDFTYKFTDGEIAIKGNQS